MLVLKRKRAESILVEGGIRITVLRIHGNAISIGIDAPEQVGIWRGELEVPAGKPGPAAVSRPPSVCPR